MDAPVSTRILNGSPGGVQFAGALGERARHDLGGAGRREAAEADERTVGNECGRFLGGEVRE